MDGLDYTLRFAKLLCFAALTAVLIFGALALAELRQDLIAFRQTASATTAAVQDLQKRIDYTSQDLDAILIQVGLITDTAQRASRAQEKYWNSIGPKTIQILNHADDLITSTRGNEDKLSQNLGSVLQQVQTTTKSANDLISDAGLKDTINNIDITMANVAETSNHLNKTSKRVDEISALAEKRAQQVLKPASLAKRVIMSTAQMTYYALRIFVLW